MNVGPTAGSFAIYNLTSTVQNWVNGNTTDNGFLLRAANESTIALLQIDNENNGGSTDPRRPHLRVQWNGWGGLRPWYKVVGNQVDDRMSIAVNVANGQLVVHHHDLGVQGVGLGLSVDRFYNSLSDLSWHLGNGWNLNAGCDVRIDLDDHDGVAFWMPDGYEVLFRNNGSGGYITPPGLNADLVKNPDSTFTLTFHGSSLKYNFQTGGCLQNEKDRNGNMILMSYNGSLATITDTENRATTFTYNSPIDSDFISKITDSANRTYQYSYDSNRNLTSYTDANNKTTNYQYNANLQMSQIKDPNGNIINFTYSSSYPQPLTQISIVDSSCTGGACNTSFAYNSGAGPCSSSGIWMNTVVTDPNSHNTTYCYDNQGRVLEVRDANNNKRQVTWNSNNEAASRTDGLGNTTTMSYDTNFNLVGVQAPPSQQGQTASSVSARYNTPNSVAGYQFLASSSVDTLTNCGAYTYDPSGNPINGYLGQSGSCDGQTGGTNTCTAYQADPSGTCGATGTVNCSNAKQGEACWTRDGDAHRTNFAYDTNGNLKTVTPPSALGATTLTVDSLSRVTAAVVTGGVSASYSYDSLDRVTQVLFGGATSCTEFTSSCTLFFYDADGNLTERDDATGQYKFIYNGRNALVKKTLPSSAWNCPGQSGMTFGFDSAGNLTSYCDSDGSVTYTYDSANRLTGVALPTGTCTGAPQLCTSYGYDNDDRLLKITFPGGASQNYSYDNAGNLTSAVGKDSSATVQTSFTYTYAQLTTDRAIRLSMTENDPSASNLTTSYSYGPLLQLTQALNSQHTWNYGYDGAGNRTSDPNGSYQFNAANELCGSSCSSPSYRYDANGNLTSGPSGGSLSYNAQNQTTSVTWNGHSLTGLAYSGSGQSERTAAATSAFASSPMGLQASSTSNSLTYFLRDPSGNIIGEETPDDSHWYFLKDGLGSVVAVINDAGVVQNRYSYDPFGGVLSSSGSVSNPWGYAGGYLDTTNLVKFGTRYYDPKLGRWTQTEPLQSSPAFTYAGDDPVNMVDPAGLLCAGLGYGFSAFIGAGLWGAAVAGSSGPAWCSGSGWTWLANQGSAAGPGVAAGGFAGAGWYGFVSPDATQASQLYGPFQTVEFAGGWRGVSTAVDISNGSSAQVFTWYPPLIPPSAGIGFGAFDITTYTAPVTNLLGLF